MKKLIAPLAAAAVTAAAFAAISVAQDNNGSGQGNNDSAVPQGAPPGAPAIRELSDEDRQALEEFRSCMKEQGVDVPGPPPAPGSEGDEGDGGDRTFHHRLKPPSEEERAKMDEALKACEDKLPEGAQFGHGPCGPPPGGPPGEGVDGAAAPGPPPLSRDS